MTRANSAPTLQTVADAVGVSRTTVSNAFSQPQRLSSSLRDRIFESADELGYLGPNPAARSLRTGQAGAVAGVVGGDLAYAFSDPYATEFWRGAATALEGAGIGLLLLPVSHHAGLREQALMSANVDGLILFALRDGDPRLELARKRKLPGVVVDGPAVEGFSQIGIDERAAIGQVTQYLLDLGHRNIAVLTFPAARVKDGAPDILTPGTIVPLRLIRERLAGVRALVEKAGIAWNSIDVQQAASNSVDAGRLATQVLLERSRPTAIIAFSDRLARGAVEAACHAGLDVPGQLSVTGFDFLVEADQPPTDLTTVVQPVQAKGRRAAELITTSLPLNPQNIVLETELHVGSTTAAPGR